MKEYKVITVSKTKAEKLMNDMAAQGWDVISTNYWSMWTISLMITFARDI